MMRSAPRARAPSRQAVNACRLAWISAKIARSTLPSGFDVIGGLNDPLDGYQTAGKAQIFFGQRKSWLNPCAEPRCPGATARSSHRYVPQAADLSIRRHGKDDGSGSLHRKPPGLLS